ncbi:MAG: hypothetical protein P1U81_07605 [Verrucomicrobiales bacterium]|jgi:hypothetical protein|nr:hypothetical protein [Verrucomicrobiales bacterium]
MSKASLKDLVSLIPELELSELRALEMSVKVAIEIRTQGQLSTETSMSPRATDEGPGLNDQALAILEEVDAFDLSLADQALLGALILSEGYHQDVFSSRDVNDIIEESGRPRIAHVTSAISGLTDRAYLTGSTKALSLSKEGRAKARGLIGMIRRRAA